MDVLHSYYCAFQSLRHNVVELCSLAEQGQGQSSSRLSDKGILLLADFHDAVKS